MRSRASRRFLSLAAVLAALMTVMALTLSAGTAGAQDEAAHPDHIHSGTCDKLGAIVWPLTSLGEGMTMDGTPMAAGQTVGQTEDIYPVEVGVTTVNAKLADIVASPHALNVHESAAKIQDYIACGNIGGTMQGDNLVIGLETQNNSGYSGVAVLHANGDQTVVTVYLAEGLSGEAAKSESGAATAAAAGTAATTQQSSSAMSVDIKSFAFAPAAINVAAGTTVTWTNDDSVAHTVTADDSSFNSGNLDPGKSFSHTFTTAGTIAYHCNYHANMHGTITVK